MPNYLLALLISKNDKITDTLNVASKNQIMSSVLCISNKQINAQTASNNNNAAIINLSVFMFVFFFYYTLNIRIRNTWAKGFLTFKLIFLKK